MKKSFLASVFAAFFAASVQISFAQTIWCAALYCIPHAPTDAAGKPLLHRVAQGGAGSAGYMVAQKASKAAASAESGLSRIESAKLLRPSYPGGGPKRIFVLKDEVYYEFGTDWSNATVTVVTDGDGGVKRLVLSESSDQREKVTLKKEKSGAWIVDGVSDGRLFGIDAQAWEKHFQGHAVRVRIVSAPLW